MSDLEKLANTPKKYTIEDRVYSVKQLSIFQLSKIREAISANKKEEYKKDVAEMASVLNEKERTKAILETIRNYRVTDEDIQAGLVSKFGMVEALSLGLKISKDKVEELIFKDELYDIMWEVFCFVMGIKDEVDKVEETEIADKANE